MCIRDRDTVIGKRAGKESVVFTLVEKKTDYYMAIKIPGKDPYSVLAAMMTLREEYGEEHFKEVFKSVTADNGSEFSRLSELEEYGVSVYFAHPYSSWERPQNERHNSCLLYTSNMYRRGCISLASMPLNDFI